MLDPGRRTLSRGLDAEDSPVAAPCAISDSAGKITIAAISRIASELDLGEEYVKRAFYSATLADASKYSDAVSGEAPACDGSTSVKTARHDSALWSVQAAAPSRMPNVSIAETSGLQRRFNFPESRGLTPGFLGLHVNGMPCSDELLGRGSLVPFPNSEPGIDVDDFFGVTSRSGAGPDTAARGEASSSSGAGPPVLDIGFSAADWSRAAVQFQL